VISWRRAAAPGTLDPGDLRWLYVFALAVVAPFFIEEQPLWVPMIFAGGLAWRAAADRWRRRQPARPLRWLLALVVVVLVYRHFHTLVGRDAGLALLITLLGVKFLEIRTRRDYVVSALLSFVVLAGRFLYEQTLWLGVYALPVVFVGIAALVHIAQPGGLPVTRKLRLAGVLVLQAVPLMLALYFLFPRLHGTLWGLPVDTGSGLTGLSERMRPGSLQNLSESSEIAFRASFEGRLPAAGERYWRALVLWRTDGQGWERGEPPGATPEAVIPQDEGIRYHVVLEASDKPFLPALDVPAAAPNEARLRNGLVLELREAVRDRHQYDLVSYPRYRSGTLSPAERAGALQLPAAVSPRVQALADGWRVQHGDPAAIARAALTHFRTENFVYTLQPPLLGPDPVDEFLFEARRGFCEHYASAFVTLMRAAHVPARVVLGYLGGEHNAAGNYLIVRQSDAHAWAEIWDDKSGWRRVDPTAAVAPERVELGIGALRRLAAQGLTAGALGEAALRSALALGWFEHLALRGRLYWDYANLSWYRWVADYTTERQERLLESAGLKDFTGTRLVLLLAAVLALMLTGYGLWLWRSRAPRDPVQASYLKLCRKLARAGLRRQPHEGALTFAARCARARPELAGRVDEITRLYVGARYGGEVRPEQIRKLHKRVAVFRG
jgi:transglutaminase-like putative cysteine protease